jgi:hypothetical protein
LIVLRRQKHQHTDKEEQKMKHPILTALGAIAALPAAALIAEALCRALGVG